MSTEIISFNIVVRTKGASFSLSLKETDSLVQQVCEDKTHRLRDLLNTCDKTASNELLECSCSWIPKGLAYSEKKKLMKLDVLEQMASGIYREMLLLELGMVKSARQLSKLVVELRYDLAASWLYWDEQEEKKPLKASEVMVAIVEGKQPDITEKQATCYSDIAARKINAKDNTLDWRKVLHYCSTWLLNNS